MRRARQKHEIVQKDPSPGTNQVRVQIFPPAATLGTGCPASEQLMVRDSPCVGHLDGPRAGNSPVGPATAPVGTERSEIGGLSSDLRPPTADLRSPTTRPGPSTTRPATVPDLDLKITTPETRVTVDSNVTFHVVLSNSGSAPATSMKSATPIATD